MDATLEPPSEEVARLRGCLNDLVSVLTLPAGWAGSDSTLIVSTVLDALLGMLRLAFVFARLDDPESGTPIEIIQVAGSLRDDPWWSWRPGRSIAWLGERSYALYLVHVPVFLFATHALASMEPGLRVGTGVMTSLTLSALLFRYVERPSRHGIRFRGGVLRGFAGLELRSYARIGLRRPVSG